jgi:hypothetical protein
MIISFYVFLAALAVFAGVETMTMKQAFEKAEAIKKAKETKAKAEASREARAIEAHSEFLATRKGERWAHANAKAAKVAAKARKAAERDLKRALAKLAITLTDEVLPAVEEIMEAVEMKKTRKSAEKRAKVAGRMAYLPVPLVLATKKRVDEDMFRQFVSYETKLKPAGILEMWARAEGITNETLFVPLEQVSKGTNSEKDITWSDEDMVRAGRWYRELGWRLLKGKTLINWNITGEWFKKMFPLAVDFTAYAQRMAVPVVNGGYFHNMEVTIANLKDDNVRSAKDGCGVYDPASTNPQIRALVDRFGAVPWQITGICPRTGLFTKGLLEPEAGASKKYNASSGIVFDVLQVKGAHKADFKAKAKEEAEEETVYSKKVRLSVGIMTIKSAPRTIALGFEQLECVSTEEKCLMVPCAGNAPALGSLVTTIREGKGKSARVIAATDKFFAVDCDDDGLIAVIWDKGSSKKFSMQSKAKMLITCLVTENFNGIKDDDAALLKFIAERDDVIAAMLKLWKSVPNMPKFSTIKTFATKLQNAKQRAAYRLATGCGVRGDQLVVVMDNTVEEGTVVTRGYKVGEEVAVWRTPNIMACGLLTLVVAEPKAHHLIDGKPARNVIRINPADCLKFQADDDGDFVGVSNDIRVVELFKCREDSSFYAVEPEGMPLLDSSGNPMAIDSNEGWDYSHVDPRGPVGVMTMARTHLLSLGLVKEAKAMMWLIQEAIDIAKRFTKFTSVEYASKPENFTVENGTVTLKDGPGRFSDCDRYEIINEVTRFVSREAEKRAGVTHIKNPKTRQSMIAEYYAWYSSDKKLNLDKASNIKGRSTLSHATFVTTALINRHQWLDAPEAFDSSTIAVLSSVATALGTSVPKVSEQRAAEVADRFNVDDYVAKISAALSKADDSLVDQANEGMLEAMPSATFEEVVALFASRKSEYFAFAAMLSPKSEVAMELGIQLRDCDYLDTEKGGKKLIAHFRKWIANCDNPSNAVVNFLERSTGHEDDGYGPLADCPCCQKRLVDTAVSVIRSKVTICKALGSSLVSPFNKRAKEYALLQHSLESGAWSHVD